MIKKPTQTELEIARRGEMLAKWDMVKEDILTLAPTMLSEREQIIGIAFWHDQLPLAEIAKAHDLTKPRISQIAEIFMRKCLHPSRRRMILSRQKPTLDTSTTNT